MGTRSRIGVMFGETCRSVYCHWDGYPSHNGRILLEHYNSSKAANLVALGDMSSLRPNFEIPEGVEHDFNLPAEDITVYYGRDRGETGTEFKIDHSFGEFVNRVDQCGAEYYYLMKDGAWYYGSVYGNEKGTLKLLTEDEVKEPA